MCSIRTAPFNNYNTWVINMLLVFRNYFTFSKRNSLPPLFHWLAPLFKIYPLRGVYAAGWMQLDANCFYFAVRANWFQRQQGNQNIYPGNKKNLQVCFCNFAIFLTSTQDLMKTQWPGSDKNKNTIKAGGSTARAQNVDWTGWVSGYPLDCYDY